MAAILVLGLALAFGGMKVEGATEATRSLELDLDSTVTLDCSGEATVKVAQWKHIADNIETVMAYSPSGERYVCAGSLSSSPSQCRDGVAIDEAAGRSIVISNAAMDDAGTYICIMADMTTRSIDVTIVNASSLSLRFTSSSTNFTRDNEFIQIFLPVNVTFSCSVAFAGFRLPSLDLKTWNRQQGFVTFPPLPRQKGDDDRDVFHSNDVALALGTQRLIANDINHSLLSYYHTTCSLPHIGGKLREQSFRVFAGPKEKSERHFVALRGPAVSLNCTEESYLVTDYNWEVSLSSFPLDYESNNPVSTPTYLATSEGRYICVVTNVLSGAYVMKTFDVTELADDKHISKHSAGFILSTTLSCIGGVVAVGMISTIVVYAVLHRRSQRQRFSTHHRCRQVDDRPPPYHQCVGASHGVLPLDEAEEMLPSYDELTRASQQKSSLCHPVSGSDHVVHADPATIQTDPTASTSSNPT